MIVVIVIAAWLIVATVLAPLLGRMIRIAELREQHEQGIQ